MLLTDVIALLEAQKRQLRFSDLLRICQQNFGEPHVRGSHHIFKTPWPGDPVEFAGGERKSKTVPGRTSDHGATEAGRKG
jgi:hypothetical protein